MRACMAGKVKLDPVPLADCDVGDIAVASPVTVPSFREIASPAAPSWIMVETSVHTRSTMVKNPLAVATKRTSFPWVLSYHVNASRICVPSDGPIDASDGRHR